MRLDDRVTGPSPSRREAVTGWPYREAPVARERPAVPYLERSLRRYRGASSRRAAQQWGWAIVALVVAAMVYNGVLALVNAHGVTIGRSEVVLSEILLLTGGGVVILATGPRPGDGVPAAFLAFFLLDALFVSMLGSDLFVDMARNAAIIAVFMMLGARVETKHVNRCFLIAAVIVAAVLILEMVSVQAYAALFQPGDYFAQTRDIAKENFDELGLFANALGFDSRFAIVTLMDHRACSIFLEQVSLANFAIVLSILLACNWRQLSVATAGFFGALIILIVLTTNSRLALGLILLTPVAAVLAPRLNRNLTLLVMPLTIIIAKIVEMSATGPLSDNLPGRLTKTVRALENLDLDAIGGLSTSSAAGFADSGYAYVIYASTIFGMIALWLFVSLVAAENRPRLLRCNLLLNLYVFCSLTVSGNSIFSMKTAALLWLMVGNLRRANPDGEVESAPALQASSARG